MSPEVSVQAAVPLLPTKKSEVTKDWVHQKIGMIGQPGIGKSEFWSHGDNTLYLQTEAGLNHLSVYKVPVRSWEDVRAVYGELIKAKNGGKLTFDTVIIDTIDRLVDLAQLEAIDRGRLKFKTIDINTVGDIPNGAGWSWAQELMESFLTKMEGLGICLVYVGHLDLKEVKTPTSSYHKLTISVGGKMGGMLASWPDHLLNIETSMQGNVMRRKLRTIPTQTMDAKSRGGMVPDGMEWGSDSKVNYAAFKSLFK